VAETTALLTLNWGHIVYTGNGGVGRVVARAAAEHLTPITLELGGKSPTIICQSASMDAAIQRVLLFKMMNAGQTCIAPDFVLVHRSLEKAFNKQATAAIKQWYGAKPEESPDWSKVINPRHTERIARLVGSTTGVVSQLGGAASGNFHPPTLVSRPALTDPIMVEEIFGPALPILPFDTIEEAIAISQRVCPRPLALYVFSENKQEVETVVNNTVSGAVCVNTVVEHNLNRELPFGGVGESGMGAYNGKWGFDEFSHFRSVLFAGTTFNKGGPIPPPPYTSDFLYNLVVKAEVRNHTHAG
jgi:aldehyde dehydrogenase (NAD+)